MLYNFGVLQESDRRDSVWRTQAALGIERSDVSAEKVRAGIAVALKQFTDRGWESDVGFIRPDETAGPTVERQLRSTNYDCVVIGGGVRLPCIIRSRHQRYS